MAYAQDRFPSFPLLTANAFDVKCRKRSARYTVRIAECQGREGGRFQSLSSRIYGNVFFRVASVGLHSVARIFAVFPYNHEYITGFL